MWIAGRGLGVSLRGFDLHILSRYRGLSDGQSRLATELDVLQDDARDRRWRQADDCARHLAARSRDVSEDHATGDIRGPATTVTDGTIPLDRHGELREP